MGGPSGTRKHGGSHGAGRKRPPNRSRTLQQPHLNGVNVHALEVDPFVQITDKTDIACLSFSAYLKEGDETPTMFQVRLTPVMLARLSHQCAGAVLSQVHTGASIVSRLSPKGNASLTSIKKEMTP